MSELTNNHLVRYLKLRRERKIGPLFNDGPAWFLGTDPYGRNKGEFISESDLADLIDFLDEPGKIRPTRANKLQRFTGAKQHEA